MTLGPWTHTALPIADKGAAKPPARLTRRAPSARYAGLVVCARWALGFGDEAQLGCRLTALGADAPPDCRLARRAIEGDQRRASKSGTRISHSVCPEQLGALSGLAY
jgi:hypothetical protein